MEATSTGQIYSGKIPIAVVLLALVLGGCNPLVGPDEPNDLMPLAIGNAWYGKATTYTPSGAVTVDDTLEIISEREIDGETWFVANDGRRFINRADGLYTIESDDNGCASCGCVSFTGKYPGRSGDSAIMTESLVLLPSSAEPVMMVGINRVVTTDTTIQTGAGRYSVHHYRTEVARPVAARYITPESRFYKPNLGPIRIERGSDSVVWRWDLVRVELRQEERGI